MGGFGTVWKGRDCKLDRTVAIKIPRSGEMSAEETDKFLREACAAAQLKHPNIVSVHETGFHEGLVFIVTDYIEGVSLDRILKRQRPNVLQTVSLCTTMAEALHYAHEAGVVHRDLKPANIMIDQKGRPHLMDFGLARRETGEMTLTLEGDVVGTPAYMSPEQASGKGHFADRRTDIYSLGVVLFEMITGDRPFRAIIVI